MPKREQKPQQGFGYNIFATAEPRYYNRNAYRFLRRMRASLVNVHPAYERTEVTRGGNKGRKKNRPKRGGGVGGRNLSAIADISLVREPDVKWGIIPGIGGEKGRGLRNRANEETCEDSGASNRTFLSSNRERMVAFN